MPLERIVTKLTKKYLLKYLENIEPNQLKLGILKGSLELKDLKLTKSALDEFYVPVKIKEGHIGNISLQIPWTKLDTQPTFILVEQLYVLLVPNTDIKFNNERTEKSREKSKHKKLLQIENAKKGQVEKLTLCSYLLGKLKKKGKQKLIKAFRNVKIQVNDINIRYEDTFADSEHPLAIGISLKKFTLTTTDENWVPCSVEKEVNEFCKVMELTCLSVFLDCNSKQFVASEKKSLVDCMQEDLFKTYEEANHNFLIWRSSPRANLKLNINPELNNYSLPLVCLKVVFNEFGLEISKVQYNGMLKLLESCERIYLENLLKEYCNPRPCCTLSEKCYKKEKNKYLLDAYKKREWRLEKDLFSLRRLSNNTSFNNYKMESGNNRWKMAQKCVLEEYIWRYRWPFTWNCIQYHRSVMKGYLIAYTQTLYPLKCILFNKTQREIKACERYLDVFSITLIRSQANILVARLRNKSAQKSEKSTEGPPMWSDEIMEKIIKKELKQEFSRQEKMTLYEDIGYLENEREAAFPREFVAVSVSTEISTLSLTLKDETQIDPNISKLSLKDMCASVSLRLADKDFQVKGTIGDLTLLGSPVDTIFQKIVESYKDEEAAVVNHLLDFDIEKSSSEGECDIKLNVASRSLQFVHDANFEKKISDFLRPQNEENLKELSKRVMLSFKRMKEQYEIGFEHAEKQPKEFDISVDLEPSYVIIPLDNKFGMDSIAISLGKVKINTKTAKNKDIECPSSQTELPWHGRLKYLTVSPYDDIKSICPWCFDDKTYKLVTNLRSHAKRHLSINSSKNATSKHQPDNLKRFELTATTDEDMTHEPQMERGEKCPTDNSEKMKSSSSSSTTDEKWRFKPHMDSGKKNEQDDLQNMKWNKYWAYVPRMDSRTKNQPDAKRQPDILKNVELTATTDEDLTHEPQMERGEKCPTDNSEKMKSSSSSSTTDEKWRLKPHMDSGKKNEQDDLQNMKASSFATDAKWSDVPHMYSSTKNQPDAKRQPDILKNVELTATTDEDLTYKPQMERGEKCQTDNSEKMKSSLSSSTTNAKWSHVPHMNSRYRQYSREKMKSTSITTGANLILSKQAMDSIKQHHLKNMEKIKSISSTTGARSYDLLKQMDSRKNYHPGNRETTQSTASPKRENTSIGPEIERKKKYQPDKRESMKAKSSIVGPYKQQIETGHFEIEEANTNTIIVSKGSKLYRIRLVKMDLAIAMTKTRAARMKCVMHRRKKTFIKKTILVTSEATKVALAKVIEMNTNDIFMIEAYVED